MLAGSIPAVFEPRFRTVPHERCRGQSQLGNNLLNQRHDLNFECRFKSILPVLLQSVRHALVRHCCLCGHCSRGSSSTSCSHRLRQFAPIVFKSCTDCTNAAALTRPPSRFGAWWHLPRPNPSLCLSFYSRHSFPVPFPAVSVRAPPGWRLLSLPNLTSAAVSFPLPPPFTHTFSPTGVFISAHGLFLLTLA